MISIPYQRDNLGQILVERDLTEKEKEKLVKQVINTNTVDYYFLEDSNENYFSLDELKFNLLIKIDELTNAKILHGFEYNGKIFSMSTNAQINWSNLLSIADSIFPIQIMDINDEPFSLSVLERQNFYYTCMECKYTKLQHGSALKIQLKSLNTEMEILDFEKKLNATM